MRGDYLSREEQAFFEALYKYMKDRNTPIERIPSLGFKQCKFSDKVDHSKIIMSVSVLITWH